MLGPGVALNAGPDQVATITGVDAFQGEVGPAQRDAFLTAMLNSERPPQPPAAAPPAAVAAMPGGDDLAQYGSWTESPDYGQVWYPQVGSDWVPYREGRWAYVAPWGWTWVDNEPWGFAPFHYGRWAEIGGRWGWVPGGVAVGVPEPVYAPALVTFLGVGAVVGVGIGAALAAGRIGWCPLGPREPFHPWYRASDRYFRQVNVSHVTNFTTINRNVTFNNFVNRRAATVVPTAAMTGSRPVASSFQRVDPAQLAQARPVIGQQPLRPAPTTFGVTPAAARQLNLPPATGQHPVAPGPGFRATPAVVSPGAAAGITAHPGAAGAAQSCAASDARCRRAAVHRNPAPGDARRAWRRTRSGDHAASRHACVCCAGSDTRSSPAGQHRAYRSAVQPAPVDHGCTRRRAALYLRVRLPAAYSPRRRRSTRHPLSSRRPHRCTHRRRVRSNNRLRRSMRHRPLRRRLCTHRSRL